MKGPRLLIWGLGAMLLLAIGIALMMPAGAVRKDIGNAELTDLQANGARIVDVRGTGEYAMGHIPGAENVPMESLQQTAASWNKDQAVVVYCATGSRSLNAAQYLAAQGFRKVYNLTAGITAWNGQVTKDAAPAVAAIKTGGKPIFIDFYSDT
jgi:rhodanese-related sulfurtransferase